MGGGGRGRLADPVAQGLGGTADLAGDGLDGGPLGGVGFPDLIDHPDGALADFGGKRIGLGHNGSILSKVGASAKPGAVQHDHQCLVMFGAKGHLQYPLDFFRSIERYELLLIQGR